MNNITFNNDDEYDIKTSSFSNINNDYKTIESYNENDINDMSNINYNNKLSENENDKENFDYINTSNNIESEMENDLKKITKKVYTKKFKKVNLIENYLIELQKFGYPEMGKIYLSSDYHEQEKTHNFFEFLVKRELEIKNKNSDLQIKLLKKQLNTELKQNYLFKKEFENKVQKQKEYIEENKNLKSIINKLNSEKNNLSESLKKFESMKSVIIKAFETMDYVQTNDMSKMLSRVKGAEKLIETLKCGYNESLEGLTKEINVLKKFIIELHNELCSILDKSCNIDENIYNFSFNDSIKLIKEAFKGNIELLKIIVNKKNKKISPPGDKSFEEENYMCFENLDHCSYFDDNKSTNNNIEINNNKFLSEDIK